MRRNMEAVRFPACRVGRPWDLVWSEVCGAADAPTILGDEIRRHVDRLVANHCRAEGAEVWSDSCFGLPCYVRGLYVDPRGQLLMRAREGR